MKYKLTAAILCLVIFTIALHNLESAPEPRFDEGWVLSLARNWVVLGHYGHLLLGEPVPSTILNAGLPATAPVALSFHLFGVGIWQGRWPNVLFLMGAVLLTYHLAQRVYGRRIAVGTLFVLLLLPMYTELHPVYMGRQALGEIPAMFFLLAGYSVLFATWKKRSWGMAGAPIFFTIALQTKPQILPFFAASLLIPILWLAFKRRWDETRWLSISFLLVIILSITFSVLSRLFLSSSLFTHSSGGNAYAMIEDLQVLLTYVVVLDPVFRLEMLKTFTIFLVGAPFLIGVLYVGFHHLRHLGEIPETDSTSIWVLILWIYVFSEMIWFYFLSIGFLRYLFPAVLIGSIFTAKAFENITSGFNLIAVFQSLARYLHLREVNAESLKLLLSVLFLLIASTATIAFLSIFVEPPDDSYAQVLSFLNHETSSTALIETYESELLLFLQRDYHYPPDSVQHILNRNVFLGEDEAINYDPVSLGINYVVISQLESWPLYDSLLEKGNSQLVYENAQYRVYKIDEMRDSSIE